jgi:hypothetical protein
MTKRSQVLRWQPIFLPARPPLSHETYRNALACSAPALVFSKSVQFNAVFSALGSNHCVCQEVERRNGGFESEWGPSLTVNASRCSFRQHKSCAWRRKTRQNRIPRSLSLSLPIWLNRSQVWPAWDSLLNSA